MKICKKIALFLSCFFAVIWILPISARAAGSIELDRIVSLTLSYQDSGTPLSGASFDLYLVATVDEFGNLTATGDFAQFPVNIQGKNDAAWNTLATTLESYVLRDRLIPTDSQVTDADGMLTFPGTQNSLTPGLYLILGSRHTQGGKYYDAAPFLTLLPGLDFEANDWIYSVTANVKCDSQTIVNESDADICKVRKIWKDSGHETVRPKKISVQLLRDGTVFDTVTLDAENNWSHTWEGLDRASRWLVTEIEPDGYTVEITREDTAFKIINTYDAKTPSSENSRLPQTGQLWWPVPVLVVLGLVFVIAGLFSRRRHEAE